MEKNAIDYQKNFIALINTIRATDKKNKNVEFYQAISKAYKIIVRQSKDGGKMIFIGNGGSAAIASHMAVDFWKNGKIESAVFNDSSLLTCIGNDFGYKNVFAKPIEFFARQNDLLFAISSSGKSENILRGVEAAQSKGCSVITLSGFDPVNPLRSKGFLNFYVASDNYGPVEVTHLYICHFLLDMVMNKNLKKEGLLYV